MKLSLVVKRLLVVALVASAPIALLAQQGKTAPKAPAKLSSADLALAKPGRDPNQAIDEAYTAGIKKYTTGKKDVKCELYLDLGVFDEHTCRAEATVCWGEPGAPATTTAAATPAATAPAETATAGEAAPVKTATKAVKRATKPKAATADAQ